MDLDSIVEARIHPAIGIARVGNAAGKHGPNYFIGPETPYPLAKAVNETDYPPKGGYRDAHGRLKRQAARFRIYGYDKAGKVVGEITDKYAEIAWTVHVANKKAAWYNFDIALDLAEAASVRSARRNAQIQGADRAQLAIDPGPREVNRMHTRARFDRGTFFENPVYLGEISYEEGGRLLFLGGHGVSGPISAAYSITTFANNAGWHDDTSDGPVSARVKIDGRYIPVDPAWVVTAPPNYAPDLVASQPLYDVIVDCMGLMAPVPGTPSFMKHILPIFRQLADAQWVNAGFAAQYGWRGLVDFTRSDLIQKLARKPEKGDDPFQELRRQIFYAFRDPNSNTFAPLAWPPIYGDGFVFNEDPLRPTLAFSITRTSYNFLKLWMEGTFTADYDPKAQERRLDELDPARQPDALDQGALHFCIGGPFHPGCEMTWPMRIPSLYHAPFRLRVRDPRIPQPDYGEFMTGSIATADGGPLSASGPGDITKWMAVPWQTDTASCLAGYSGSNFPDDNLIPAFWPSRVPNTVLSETNYKVVADANEADQKRLENFNKREVWIDHLPVTASYLERVTKMVDHFHELGIIERREKDVGPNFPRVMYVETFADGTDGVGPKPVSEARARTPGSAAHRTMLHETLRARFQRGGRR